MSLSQETDSTVDFAVLENIDTTSASKIAACKIVSQPSAVEYDIKLEPETTIQHDGGMCTRSPPAVRAARDYRDISAIGNSRQINGNTGHVFNSVIYNYQTPARIDPRDRGFDFDIELSSGGEQQLSAFESAYECRASYTSRKRPVVSPRLVLQSNMRLLDCLMLSYLD